MTSITRPRSGVDLPHRFPLAGLASLVRRRTEEVAWVRPAFWGVTALAAILYVVNLTVSGYANTYYSAAALAGSQSWSAWFFGSFDAANFITVDKPPLSTMVMGLSVRLFGLSSWSILLPQALMGVASVALLFAIVRRSHGPVAATIAGLVMALTPAAVLIFRYNNPDALLTLLLVAAAGAFLRSLEDGRIRWVVVASLLVGFAFNTKLLQAYLVLPTFALTYLIAAPGHVWRRLGMLAIALVIVLVSSSWWVLATVLVPASVHPFIGGSTNNSALDLIFGYNGLARIFGNTFGGGGGPGGIGAAGPGGGAGFSGSPGLLRLFNSELGGQVAWLFGFSLVGMVSGLALRWRAPRTDSRRAATLMWGGWLLVTAAVFSFMSGIIHTYYSVALGPAIGALVGIGVVELWQWRRRSIAGGLLLGAAIAGSGLLAWWLLSRTPNFAPGLGLVILGVSALVAVIVALPHAEDQRHTQMAAVALGMAVLLAAPGTYAVDTMLTAHSGGDPSAGPTFGGFGGFGGPGGGGPGTASTDSALISYLLANQDGATWIVATTSAQEAGSLELAAGKPVMAMGGFTGSDPAPSLDEFKALVAGGKVRYVLVSGRGGFGPAGGSSSVSAIDRWAESVGTPVSYGGSATLYDLGALATGASTGASSAAASTGAS
jgi:4-amino-4-deoxy-L-arabinose transferase-like glycosyltransferase